jgi:ABC-type dipeptide/oligopeptide/nickel transport system permease subunit
VGRYDPYLQDLSATFRPPSLEHFFGTDEFGRDIFARVAFGARISLVTAALTVVAAACIGVPLGLIAGYRQGWVDELLMRITDVMLAIPALLLAMVVVAILGPGIFNALIAVAIVSIPAFARLARANTLSLRQREFVTASRAVGAGPIRIVVRGILPNALGPLIVQCAIAGGAAILIEAGLSFLGLGARPPEASWGSMLASGRAFLHLSPWYGLFPGLMITLTVLSLNVLADGLSATLTGGRPGGSP